MGKATQKDGVVLLMEEQGLLRMGLRLWRPADPPALAPRCLADLQEHQPQSGLVTIPQNLLTPVKSPENILDDHTQ